MRGKLRAAGAVVMTTLFLSIAPHDGAEELQGSALTAEERAALTALLGERVVGRSLVAETISKPTDWYPLREGVLTYDITGGKAAGSTQEHVFQRLEDESDGWGARMGDARLHLGISDDGTIVIEAEETLPTKMLSRFSPPQPLVPAGMKPGDTTTASTDVAVYRAGRPDRVKLRGSLRVRCSYLGAFEVRVPSGSYDAALLKSTFEGKIGPATVRETEYRFLAEGVGTVAMVIKRNNSAVLVYRDRFEVGKVLVAQAD